MTLACLREIHPSSRNLCATWGNRKLLVALGSVLMLVLTAGCGGGGMATGGGGTTPSSTSTMVTVTTATDGFALPLTALAVQTGTGSFVAIPLPSSQPGQISFIVPAGVSKYSVAYLCEAPPAFTNIGFGR